MTSAKVDLVRSVYAAWERGDFSSTEWAHPEIEFVFADGPSPGIWTGLAGLARGTRELLGAWEGLRCDVEGFRELVAERVRVLVDFSGRGRPAGLEVGQLRAKGRHLA